MQTPALKDYTDLIHQWAKDRKIIPNAKPATQWLKGLEEIGELAAAHNKGDKAAVQDAIGDVYVCLANFCSLVGAELPTQEWTTPPSRSPIEAIAKMCSSWGCITDSENPFRGAYVASVVSALRRVADQYQLTLTECVAAAWEQIKDRKGTTTPEGLFIKEQE